MNAANIMLGLGLGDSMGAHFEKLGKHNPEPTPIHLIPSDRLLKTHGRYGKPGYPTDDTLLALTLTRALVSRGKLAPDWDERYLHFAFGSSTPATGSMGHQTRAVHAAIKNGTYPDTVPLNSEANGSIMCVAPIALLSLPLSKRITRARRFSQLTHPGPVTADINEVFVQLLDDPTMLPNKPPAIPADPNGPSKGWCVLALAVAINAAMRVREGEAPVDALRWVYSLGGDTDTSGAVAGALIGALPDTVWPTILIDQLSARQRLLDAAHTLTSAV